MTHAPIIDRRNVHLQLGKPVFKLRIAAKARVFRRNELIYNGEVVSLRRFKDDVKEVKAGLECGIRLDNFADFEEGDKIDCFEIELKKATL